MNIELDLVEKVFFAVACPVFASALLVTFYVTQHRWEKRRDQRFWKERQAEWVDCDQETYAKKLKGIL